MTLAAEKVRHISPRAAAEPQTSPLLAKLRTTFESGKTASLEWRQAQLERLEALVSENEPAIVDALSRDLGRPALETWIAEVKFTQKEAKFARKNLRSWTKPERARTPAVLLPATSRVERQPLGVVLIIAPWNYPLQLALAPLVAAIAAGNCAIVKPSELTPHTSTLLADLIPKYLDRDAIAVVEGGVAETTELLEQRFDHIFYTGNGTVARVVMAAAAKHLTPVTLELGGKSPAIIDASADLDVAARRIVWGKFLNAGQTCVAPDYVLAHASIEEAFTRRLVETVRDFFGADPSKSEDYARIVNERHTRRLIALLSDGEAVCGGEHDVEKRYLAPTILKNVKLDSAVMTDEIFGPILPVISVANLDEAVRIVNAREKPLALYIFGDGAAERSVLARTSSGGVSVNDTLMHLNTSELPFGGVGPSGQGAYHGRAGFETFSHRRSILSKSTFLDLAVRYPPFDEPKRGWFRRLMGIEL